MKQDPQNKETQSMTAAARKTPVEEPKPYNLGLDSDDVQLPRLRVVGKLSKLVELDVAKSGDLAIGSDAEDEGSQIIHALNGKETLRVYVLAIRSNYACGYAAVQKDPALAGSWEEGDPEMPREAKKQFHYTLFVPQHSDILPVVYTASGAAAGEARRRVNTRLGTEALVGNAPYEFAWDMSTKINTAGTNSWPGPVFALAEPDPDEVAKAKQMHDDMGLGYQRAALPAGGVDATPTF
jgi:hypothetical protein